MKQVFITILLLLIVFSLKLPAQDGGWVVGYNIGMFTPKQRYFTILEYKTDRDYPEANFNMPNITRGINFGYQLGNENLFAEILLTNKVLRSSLAQANNSQGELHSWKVKLKIRSLNLGAAVGNENLKIGKR